MEALVITLREGIEAALVLGIILAYLRKTGRMALSRQVYIGLGLAVVASVTVAMALRLIGLDPDNPYLEGTMLAIAALLVAGMVVWMWLTAKGTRRVVETRLQAITAGPAGKAAVGGGLGLLLLTFVMVFREGVEMVIFLWATALGEKASLFNLLGGAFGLSLAVLFAVLFVRGSIKINLARFFGVTGVVLLVFAAKLLIGSIHEFAEAGVLPLPEGVDEALAYLVSGGVATAIVMALIAVPIFLLLWESLRQTANTRLATDGSPAEQHKWLESVRFERVWQVGLAVATVLILFALGSTAFVGS